MDSVLHTNHFIGRHFADEDLPRQAIPDSTSRLERLTQLLDDAGPEVSPTKISRLLSDHKGFPTSICYHVETGSAPHDSFTTGPGVGSDRPCEFDTAINVRATLQREFPDTRLSQLFQLGQMGGRPSLGTP